MEDYERTELIITEFDSEDIITTSGLEPFKYSIYEGFLA